MNDEGASDGKVDGCTVGRSTGAVLGFGCGNRDKLLVSKAKSCQEMLLLDIYLDNMATKQKLTSTLWDGFAGEIPNSSFSVSLRYCSSGFGAGS